MKKRLVVCVLAGLMVLGTFTGCGSNESNSKADDNTKTEETTDNKKDADSKDSKTNEKDTNANLTEDLSEYSDIEWPDSTITSVIPKPKSMVGKIALESDDTIMVEIANTSDDDFNNYVDECKDMGYTNDYAKTEYMYTASNDNGYELVLSMSDDHVMSIMASTSDE